MGDLATTPSAMRGTATISRDELEPQLEHHRSELTGYCYRMLGSGFEAEDAVQETMVRAWRNLDRFEGRSSLRSWLYRIATNVCFDMLKGPQRRARPMDLGPASSAEAPLGDPLPDRSWVGPMPDDRVLSAEADPAARAADRETIRLAFVAALQHLPARQRAVLILREVLRWKASEVAALLDTTVASVNSALQRARATLASSDVGPDMSAPTEAMDETQTALLARYLDAFERYDIESLVALLHEDATFSMPPFALWLRGPTDVAAFYLGPGAACRGSRLVPVAANGVRGFGQYKPAGGGTHFEPWALQVIETSADGIVGIHNFLDTAHLFPLFGLPPRVDL